MSQKIKTAFKAALPVDDLRRMLGTGKGQMMIVDKIREFRDKQGLSESVSTSLNYKKGVYKDVLDLFEPFTDPKLSGSEMDYSRRLTKLLKQEKMRGVKTLKYDSFRDARAQAGAARRVIAPSTPPKGSMRGSVVEKDTGVPDSRDTDPPPIKASNMPKGKKKLRVVNEFSNPTLDSESTSSPPGQPPAEEMKTPPPKTPRKKTGDKSGAVLNMKGRKPRKKTGTKSGAKIKSPSAETLAAEAKARGAPAPIPAPAPAPPPAPAPEPEKKDPRVFDPKISDADPIAPLPTKGQMIPSSRLSSSGKKASELRDDIRYFLNNFPDLEKEAAIYKKLGSRATKTDLVKLHARIVGKVRPAEDPRTDAQGRRVGVVLDGESYIRGIVNDMITDQRMSGLRPEGLVSVNQSDEGKGDGVKDIGDFEVVPQPDGGYAAKREAIYRFQPSENEKAVNPSKAKNKRLTISKSGKGERMNNLRTNALKSFKRDPFTTKQPKKRLNYLF